MKSKLYLSITLIMLLLTGCSALSAAGKTETPLIAVTLPVGYIPNVQFAPLYVAIDKGFYAAKGIDVTLDYSMENDNAVLLGAGELQFAILSGEQVMLARDKEMPLVNVMTWYQEYPVGVAAKSSSGITTIQDLAGKKIGLPGLYGASYIGLIALLDAGGLNEADVTLDSIGYNQIEVLMADRDDAVVIYAANEPVQLEHLGQSISLLKVSDFSAMVGNGLVTNEKTLNEDPELVRAMVEATLQGIEYSIENPDEAYEISKKYVENLASADQEIQKQVLVNSIEHWKAEQLGFSQPSAWENMARILAKMGLLTKEIDISSCFTNEFIP